MSKTAWAIGHRKSRLVLAFLVTLLMTASMLVAIAVAGSANSETPAERCARETSAYNAAWVASWSAANPGSDPSQAPPPPVPYVCRDPGEAPTTTPTSPELVTPGIPTTTPESPSGPNVGAHAPTDIPAPGETPIVPVPGIDAQLQTIDPLQMPGRREADGPPNPSNGSNDYVEKTCYQNFYDCKRSRDNRDKEIAEEESVGAFPGDQESTRADAARHCIWQGLMTESANLNFAEQMGAAHEMDGDADDSPDTPGGKDMDLFNNNTGREIGRNNEGNRDAIISQCIALARSAQRVGPGNIPESHSNSLIFLRGA